MRKFLSLVLALVMALSLCAPAWAADPADVSTFEQLKTAITDGATEINLIGSITVNEDYTLTGVTITVAESVTSAGNDAIIVSNNATLTLGAGTTITGYSALLLAYGGNIEIGAGATVEATGATSNGKIFPAVLAYTGTVTVNGGTITSSDNALVATTSQGKAVIEAGSTVTGGAGKVAAYSYGGGSITMNGGTVNGSLTAASSGNTVVNDGKVNGNVAAYGDASASAKIEGGEVTGTVYKNDGATLSITGGTFAVDPTPYVAEGYKAFEIVEADGGGYFVAVPYDVTFDANGGNGVLTQAPVPAGQFTLPTEHPFTREGYTFVGWATDKDATEVLGATYDVTGAVTFYAIWEEEECMGDSHVKVLVEYSGDVATKVYCDYCKANFAFVQGTEDDAKDKFGEGNYVNAENDVWYTLKAQSGEVPSVPETPPVEDDKTEGEEVAVTTPAEVDTVVNNTVIDAVKNSAETTVTVTTPVEGDADAETTIKFDSAEAKQDFASATDITTALTAVEEIVTDEVTAKVEEKVSDDAKLAAYLDIDITVFADGDPVGEITQLPKEIKVVIPASALDFGDLEKNHTRKVSVIRFHDDQVDVIPAKLEADGSVSFYSHLFSTYAVVYEDVATSTNYPIYYWPVGDTTTTDEDVTSPKTFDAGVALYVGMSVAAAVGTVTLGKKRED